MTPWWVVRREVCRRPRLHHVDRTVTCLPRQKPQADIDGAEEVTSEAAARGRICRHRLRQQHLRPVRQERCEAMKHPVAEDLRVFVGHILIKRTG